MNNMSQFYWGDFIDEIRNTLVEGSILLDAGAGDCHWKKHFPPHVKYIGMDLGVADDVYDYSPLDIKGDLTNIPLDDNSVDAVISIQVLEHVTEPSKVLAEFNRVLKPGQHLFLTCPQAEFQHQTPYDFFRYTPYGLRELLELNNFEVLWIRPQKGNFNHIYNELRHSLAIIPTLSNNYLTKLGLKIFVLYFRLIFAVHEPLLLYFDRFKELQDSPVGHFAMARKVSKKVDVSQN
jgi:SAM-dependent methyltransferase